MRTETDLKDFIRQLRAFTTPITVYGSNGARMLDMAIDEDPAIMYYIGGMRAEGGFGWVRYHFTYRNTDVPANALLTVSSESEAQDALADAMTTFKRRLIMVSRRGVDFGRVYNDFSITYQGFYSNLVDVRFGAASIDRYGLVIADFTFSYRLGKVMLSMMSRDVEEELKRVARTIFTPSMTPEVKAYVAHNYLARTVEYWLKEEANPIERSCMQSAYGALVKKKCVCQGFAEAYKRLLDTQGIRCFVIIGKVKGDSVGHAWNAITFDGREYFHVDVTWDSKSTGRVSDTYFGLSDTEMVKNRLWTRRPECICSGKTNILSIIKSQILSNKRTLISQGVKEEYLVV